MKNNQKSDVCIIVATFNRAELLKETLNSLASQTRPAEKIIVVDDGSTDNTREVVANFDGNIEYIFKENDGKSRAVNEALKHTEADYIWIFDDDDIALPNALELLIKPLEEDPAMDFSHGGITFFKVDDSGQKIDIIRPEIQYIEPGRHFESLLLGCSMCHIATLIKRECYVALGGLDEELIRSLDYDFLLRLTRQFKGINILHQTIRCRIHEGERGDIKSRHSTADRSRIHFQYDQIILDRLRIATNIAAYIGKSEYADLTNLDYFNAYFNRAISMGSHGLWREYLEDISECKKYNYGNNYKLTPEQWLQISSCFSAYYAIEKGRETKGFPFNAIDQTIHVLGKEAGKPIARGFYWSTKKNAKHKMDFLAKIRYSFYVFYTLYKK